MAYDRHPLVVIAGMDIGAQGFAMLVKKLF
jgi:hypothetical protein